MADTRNYNFINPFAERTTVTNRFLEGYPQSLSNNSMWGMKSYPSRASGRNTSIFRPNQNIGGSGAFSTSYHNMGQRQTPYQGKPFGSGGDYGPRQTPEFYTFNNNNYPYPLDRIVRKMTYIPGETCMFGNPGYVQTLREATDPIGYIPGRTGDISLSGFTEFPGEMFTTQPTIPNDMSHALLKSRDASLVGTSKVYSDKEKYMTLMAANNRVLGTDVYPPFNQRWY